MRREMVAEEELTATLRKEGISDVSEVASACLEADGEISVLRKRSGGGAARHRQKRHGEVLAHVAERRRRLADLVEVVLRTAMSAVSIATPLPAPRRRARSRRGFANPGADPRVLSRGDLPAPFDEVVQVAAELVEGEADAEEAAERGR